MSKEQGVNNAIYACAGRESWRFWPWGEMARLLTGQAALALEIIPGDLDVPHGHPWLPVAEQFHERRYGYARLPINPDRFRVAETIQPERTA